MDTVTPSKLHSPALGFIVLVGLGLFAYSNSFDVPFLLDDHGAIESNPTLRTLWPPTIPLSPPAGGNTVGGRPIVNLSLALNYAIGELSVTGYHVFNLLLHLAVTALLFGVLRRTLQLATIPESLRNHAKSIAWGTAALYVAHPLTTSSVTYIVQRAECLMALFYFGCFYCMLRGLDSPHRARWFGGAIACSALGMGTKEVMVTAPVMLCLFDRVFVAGSWKKAWNDRWYLYLGLGASWLVLLALSGGRGNTAGFGSEVSALQYFCTQLTGIPIYLKSIVWPFPMIFDYGSQVAHSVPRIVFSGLGVALLLVLIGLCFRKYPKVSFLGVGFFVILSPTTSFVPVATQTLAEHRLYLPLAAALTLMVLALHRWIAPSPRMLVAVTLLFSLLGGWGVQHRNEICQTELGLWRYTIEHFPNNARAHVNFGYTFAQMGESHFPQARSAFEAALQVDADNVDALYNRGTLNLSMKRYADAIADFTRVLEINSNHAKSHNNRGRARLELAMLQGSKDLALRAVADCDKGVRLAPGVAEFRYNRGRSYGFIGQHARALADFNRALELHPDYHQVYKARAVSHYGLGNDAAAWQDVLRWESTTGTSGDGIDSAFLRALEAQTPRPR